MEKRDTQFWKSMYTLATVGINLVVATFIGLGLGLLVDNKLFHGRTAPWFTVLFLVCGINAGFRNFIKLARRKMDDEGGPEDGKE
jgi:ATP synthase protein I